MGKITKYKEGDVVGDNGIIFIENVIRYNKGKKRRAIFECSRCGKYFNSVIDSIRYGGTVSCGCYHRAMTAKRSRKHYLRGTKLYIRWQNIKKRCLDENNKMYKYYGGRGISIYKPWINDPIVFVNYCKTVEGWDNPDLTIDRIDNNGNYEPGNIRFVNWVIQANNHRMQENNTSGYIGVYWNKKSKKFMAHIKYDCNNTHIGYYKTKAEAVAARNQYIIDNNLPLNKIQQYA